MIASPESRDGAGAGSVARGCRSATAADDAGWLASSPFGSVGDGAARAELGAVGSVGKRASVGKPASGDFEASAVGTGVGESGG